MEFETVFKIRKSCRQFNKEKKIDSNIVKKIIWAGKRSPYASGGPRRNFKIVENYNLIQKLQGACHGQKWVGQSDKIIVVSGFDKEKGNVLRSNLPKYVHDCSAAMMSMILMATYYQIGSCWIGHFKVPEVKKICSISHVPVAILLLGYPKEKDFFNVS